jgi:hypothetical protein
MMTIPGFDAESSVSRPTPIHHIAMSASNASSDPAVVPAQSGQNPCPVGFECSSCQPLPSVLCTEGSWTGWCVDYTSFSDGTRTQHGGSYWCGLFSGGPHFNICR